MTGWSSSPAMPSTCTGTPRARSAAVKTPAFAKVRQSSAPLAPSPAARPSRRWNHSATRSASSSMVSAQATSSRPCPANGDALSGAFGMPASSGPMSAFAASSTMRGLRQLVERS